MAYRIFLIEDHEWLLDIQARMLNLEDDIEVCGTALSAEAALDALPDAVDAVLVDLTLPGMSGLDFVRDLASRRPDVACVVVSAQPAVVRAAAAHDAGAVAYVEKGDPTALLAAIRSLPSRHD